MPFGKSLRWYAVLVTLAILTAWLASVLMPRESADGKPGGKGQIDYYSRSVQRTVLDEQGKPRQMLLAEVLYHYPDDDRTELENPVLTLYGTQGTPWVIRSETALLPAGGEIIYLNGKVSISRAADKNGRKLDIVTRNARIRPNDEYAETSEFIQMSSPPDQLSGKGAEVHFGENVRIKLLSEVRRRHDAK